jgi:hypothetical protein
MEHQRMERKWRVVLLLGGVTFLLLIQVLLNYTWIGGGDDEEDDFGQTETFLVPRGEVVGTSSEDEEHIVAGEPDTAIAEPKEVDQEGATDEEPVGLPIETKTKATRFQAPDPVEGNEVRLEISQYLAQGKKTRGRPSSHCAAYSTQIRGEDGKNQPGIRVALIRRQGWWSHQRSWSGPDMENLRLFVIQDREVLNGGVSVTRQEVNGEDFSVKKGVNWYFPWPIKVGQTVQNTIEFANGALQDTQMEIAKLMPVNVAGQSFPDCFLVKEEGEDQLPEGVKIPVSYEYVFCRDAGRISVKSFGADGEVIQREDLLWSTAEGFQPWQPEALEACKHLQSFE